MKKITSLLFLAIIIISCQSEKEKQINEKSLLTFNNSVEKINKSKYKINIDSFRTVYENHKSDSPKTGLEFAIRFENYAKKLLKNKEDVELAEKSRNARMKERKIKEDAENKSNWESSKYGKLQKRYPSWTNEECIKVVNKEIWIGMTYQMLIYMRGKPNTINKSNYGNGINYQFGWDDYKPKYFYSGEDQIISSYN